MPAVHDADGDNDVASNVIPGDDVPAANATTPDGPANDCDDFEVAVGSPGTGTSADTTPCRFVECRSVLVWHAFTLGVVNAHAGNDTSRNRLTKSPPDASANDVASTDNRTLPDPAAPSDRATVNNRPFTDSAEAAAASFTATCTDDGPAGVAGASGTLRPGTNASSAGAATGDTATGTIPTFVAAPDAATSADAATGAVNAFGRHTGPGADAFPARGATLPTDTDFSTGRFGPGRTGAANAGTPCTTVNATLTTTPQDTSATWRRYRATQRADAPDEQRARTNRTAIPASPSRRPVVAGTVRHLAPLHKPLHNTRRPSRYPT